MAVVQAETPSAEAPRPRRSGLGQAWFRLRDDRTGSVAIITAFASVMIFASAALAIDVGSFYVHRREQQTATDLAALIAGGDLGNAQRAAAATLAQNGIDPSTLKNVELGTYTADASLTPSQRFQPGTAVTPNAVRLTVQTAAPMIFGTAILAKTTASGTASPSGGGGANNGVTVTTTAIGTQANFASFAIGSRLASLNNGLLNSLLGQLLGANVSLSLMDYQSLASANIDLFTFSKALATRANLTTLTYGSLGSASVRVGDVFGALADTAQSTGQSSGAISALSQIAASQAGSFGTMSIGPLVAYGPFTGMPTSTQVPIKASVSALDILTASAEIAGKQRLISLSLPLSIPGIASATLQLAIGERPVGTSFVGMGPTGTTVSTAQTRLLVTVALTGTAPITTISLPIYLELASATATLSALQCGPSAAAPALTLGVTPSVVDAWIGSLPAGAMTAFGTAPSVQPAALVNILNLITVTGRAHAAMTNMTPTSVAFSSAAIAAQTKQTTSTTDFTASLLASLNNNLSLTVTAGPLNLTPPLLIQQSVAATIAAAATPIDQLLTQVLQTLGLGVGEADTWVTGVRCGGGVLVN